MSDPTAFPSFSAPYAADDCVAAARLLGDAGLSAAQHARIDRTAARLIGAIRAHDDRLGGVEDMLREFALSTKEGLALMVLAEALLRVPDARTADQFIEDKLGQGDFLRALGIEIRADRLKASRPEAAPVIERQLNRLTAEDQMGSLFKAAAIFSPRSLTVPGFET